MNTLNNSNTVSLPRRVLVILYDSILLVAVLFFMSLPIIIPFEITTDHILYPLYIVYIYAIAFLFFAWSWTHGGQTLGLKTWKIKLVSVSGNQVTWKESFMRYIGSLLCWLSCGIGFLWCYTNKERLAWNDLISNTRLTALSSKSKSKD